MYSILRLIFVITTIFIIFSINSRGIQFCKKKQYSMKLIIALYCIQSLFYIGDFLYAHSKEKHSPCLNILTAVTLVSGVMLMRNYPQGDERCFEFKDSRESTYLLILLSVNVLININFLFAEFI
jgi:hypothetical protein